MLGLGLMLLLVGFAIVVPSGGSSGPAVRRHHDMGLQGIETTPDDRHRDRRGVYRALSGVVLIGLGVLCVALAG